VTGSSAHAEHWGPSLGPVILDIGGEVGALVVSMPAHLEGAELEIRRPPEPWTGRHVAVRARSASTGSTCAAVFGGLHSGRYELRVRGERTGAPRPVVVRGGDVVWHRWEDTRSPEQPSGAEQVAESRDRADNTGKEHSHAC
jgi:hypothetical protein